MDIYTITTQEILDTISRHCPECLSVYLQCINRCDGEGKIFFSKKQIDVDMSESFVMFRNKVKKLAKENLLEWHPIDDGISITIADIENVH